jgi:hypothetical protein
MILRRKNKIKYKDFQKIPASWTRSSEPEQLDPIYVNKS